MHTEGLSRKVVGNDDLPEFESTLPENPNADQQAVYNAKMHERAVLIQQRKKIELVIPLGSGAEQNHFNVHIERTRANRWEWR